MGQIRKRGGVYGIRYCRNGKRYEESARTGKPKMSAQVGRMRFEHAIADIEADYTVNGPPHETPSSQTDSARTATTNTSAEPSSKTSSAIRPGCRRDRTRQRSRSGVLRGQHGRRWCCASVTGWSGSAPRRLERTQTTWPREFRYTGKRFRTEIDGRYVEPGDTVSLNAQQAEAFRDRFAPVAAEAPPAVTA